MTARWPFSDPPNCAVIVHHSVLSGAKPIVLVLHDADDGGWQFLSHETGALNERDGRVVGLGEIIALDPSLIALADLPVGWKAWRPSKEVPWQRSKSLD